ncbi:18311_t:CDS:2, partial [Racocetra fulgida]
MDSENTEFYDYSDVEESNESTQTPEPNSVSSTTKKQQQTTNAINETREVFNQYFAESPKLTNNTKSGADE